MLIDDSIVRGTTSGIIVKMLKEAGAKEVYMCVSSPTIEYSCHYGIDTSVRKELIASTHTVDEIKDYIHADKLHYLSREGLCRAISNVASNDLCFACFNAVSYTHLDVYKRQMYIIVLCTLIQKKKTTILLSPKNSCQLVKKY